VLLNVVSNAIKYNRENGKVEFSCEKNDTDGLVINVVDTGIGIAENQLPRLFTPFERLSAEQSGIEGTGLGLAVSDRLVRAMGGTIGVRSQLGEGTTISLSFPIAENPASSADSIAQL